MTTSTDHELVKVTRGALVVALNVIAGTAMDLAGSEAAALNELAEAASYVGHPSSRPRAGAAFVMWAP